MNDKTGGSAFPEIISDRDNNGAYDTYSYGGMTLRDYFAGQALTGVLVNLSSHRITSCADAAGLAYDYADAMFAERERTAGA